MTEIMVLNDIQLLVDLTNPELSKKRNEAERLLAESKANEKKVLVEHQE